jgi:gamma-glutamylcyclotransferase (GGCT)/AIG2-like uncharacterized protein YtfP
MGVELLFVYGTLRRGGANAMHLLHPDAVFVGNAGVRGRLYDMGGYPALVLDDEAGLVAGEVYEIDADTLQVLDEFEAAAQYARKRVVVVLNGAETSCWVYGPGENLCISKDLIGSGDWIDHAGG